MKSLMHEGWGVPVTECLICGATGGLEKHHMIPGTANRKKSEQWGLWAMLCHECHTGRRGVHTIPSLMQYMKRCAQKAFEKEHSRELWMQEFGKNYL